MGIHDSRSLDKNNQAGNRKRFIERHKDAIKRRVDEQIYNTKIKKVNQGKDISVSPDEEPSFNYDSGSDRDIVLPGNDTYNVGDKIAKPSGEAQGQGGAGPGETGEDDFEFYLSKEELIEVYFNDMELPDMVKEAVKAEIKYSLRTGGYTKEGIPPRLAIKKTFENAIARRIANKKEGHKSPFIDDVDLRYIRKYKVPEPYTKAVMFCMMDVSGSMTEYCKKLAKKFYVLLYMFLSKFYKDIDVVFIRYHSFAREVDEQEFFYGKDTGGTVIADAQDLVLKIVEERYPVKDYNLYLAHASDGDIWRNELEAVVNNTEILLDKFQYIAYIETIDPAWGRAEDVTLYRLYEEMVKQTHKIGAAKAKDPKEIYPALRELFKKKGIDNET